MTDWDLMKKIAKAKNTQNQTLLAQVILDNDIDGNPGVISIAISSFDMTQANIEMHIAAAKKLASTKEPEDFRTGFRHVYLNEAIK
jgi:hypothetical protein